jgi:hypothetical protein
MTVEVTNLTLEIEYSTSFCYKLIQLNIQAYKIIVHNLIYRQLYSIVLKIVLSHNYKTDFLPDDYFSHKTFQTLLMKRLFKFQVNFSSSK